MAEEQLPHDSQKPKALSFGFSKTLPKSKLVSEGRNENEKDFVLQVVKGEIASTKPKAEKKELVIPCSGNTLQLTHRIRPRAGPGADISAEDQQAARELIGDSKTWLVEQDEPTTNGSGTAIIPLSQPLTDKDILDKDLVGRADTSSIDDYENVPVSGFGMGLLRGMGFKEGQGIGGFKTASVACIEPVIRPKGLGLGASRPKSQAKDGKSGTDQQEELSLRKSAYVLIELGTYKDLYGQIEGLDEESARVFVRLALGGRSVSVSENCIRVVSKQEFKNYARLLNKESYQYYQTQQEQRETEWARQKSGCDDETKDVTTHRRHRSRSPNGNDQEVVKKPTWLRPLLKVRIIDKKYKSGRYYNAKVVVEDVISNDFCICRTSDGHLLEKVRNELCETLIPKSDLSVVMIVAGKWRHHLAEILGRDKKSYRVTVQLLPDKEAIVKLDYDDVCEYVGDLTDV